jgi:hypothetical protein
MCNNKDSENAPTSHNRIVYASPPKGGSGYEKTQSGYALCAVFSPPHLGQGAMLRIALLPAPNVVYFFYVMRHNFKIFVKNKEIDLSICLCNSIIKKINLYT